jgi:tripartite-type tricarboxylate transporter receptor subunit TctC
MRRIAGAALAAVLIMAGTMADAATSDYPNHPTKIVVPYPARGPSDTAAGILAEPPIRAPCKKAC